MKQNLTELVFILDKSGSMHGLESDTIGGFNSMLEKQKAVEGDAYITTVLFNDASEIIQDRIPIKQISPMTDEQYRVCGCTALLDSIGSTINHIANIHKYARQEDVPEHTLVAIMTDGLENASHQYNIDSVKKLIKEQEKKGWQFIFMGANMDAVEQGVEMGFRQDHSVTFANDSVGQRLNYQTICDAAASVRSCGCLHEDIFAPVKEYKKKVDKEKNIKNN